MPNFADVTGMTIPEGEIVKIVSGSTVLWEKATTPTLPETEFSGVVEAYEDEGIYLYAEANIGSDYTNLYIVRTEPTTDANTVYRVDGKKVTYGDGTVVSNGIDVTFCNLESDRYYDGLLVTVDSGYFEGEYEWGFDKR